MLISYCRRQLLQVEPILVEMADSGSGCRLWIWNTGSPDLPVFRDWIGSQDWICSWLLLLVEIVFLGALCPRCPRFSSTPVEFVAQGGKLFTTVISLLLPLKRVRHKSKLKFKGFYVLYLCLGIWVLSLFLRPGFSM